MLLIQSALFFILGAAGACFFMLLLVPFIWRRALYLATKAVRMEIPLSLNEVEAEYDAARALHAVELCRMEQQIATAKAQSLRARQVLDMAQAQICYLMPFEEEADKLQQKIIQMREGEEELARENKAQRLKLEKLSKEQQKGERLRTTLKIRNATVKSLKRQISSLKKHILRLEKQNEVLENAAHQHRHNTQIDSEEVIKLRQEMKQISAQIIADIAQAPGSNITLPPLDDAGEGDDLAAVIRQVMAAPPPVPAPLSALPAPREDTAETTS